MAATSFPSDNQSLIVQALENPRYQWRTIQGLAKELSIPEREVRNYIASHQDIVVQSSVPTQDGSDLFTTRRKLRQANPMIRLIGAFKNRAV
ncbi:MAG: hypothetical protein VKN60_10135 [Cyanobacteriota bacterium]|nr:hypothetical protein [Cyanobacteriota bacterium]